MFRVRFSNAAVQDLVEIDSFTLRTWRSDQADKYLAQFQEFFAKLGLAPRMGRPCAQVRPDLRRVELGRHVVFYPLKAEEIVVSRILHQGMLPRWELFGEDD